MANKSDTIIQDLKVLVYSENDLKYNVVTRELELNTEPISDIDLNSIFVSCKETIDSKISSQTIGELLHSRYTPAYNPFKEFFDNPPKEYIPVGGITKLIQSITTDTPNHQLFITKWMTGLVRSAYFGDHSPLYLILCGGQNTGKSEWFRRLLPKELKRYYAESKFSEGKDDDVLMARKLIILDDEMAGKSKIAEAQMKNRTSKQGITVRLPYAKVDTTLNRICMLCGTSNEMQVLNDPTGNRRFLPINVININHSLYNSIDKGNLLHECFNLLMSGYSPDLTSEEIKLLNDSTKCFETVNEEEELINKLFSAPDPLRNNGTYFTATDVVIKMKGWNPSLRSTAARIGTTLNRLGYRSSRPTVNGKQGTYYCLVEESI